MDDIERRLWAEVFAAEFAALRARSSACFVPSHGENGNWSYGSAIDRDLCHDSAKEQAGRAVNLLRATAK